jgi:hypothetical protein
MHEDWERSSSEDVATELNKDPLDSKLGCKDADKVVVVEEMGEHIELLCS